MADAHVDDWGEAAWGEDYWGGIWDKKGSAGKPHTSSSTSNILVSPQATTPPAEPAHSFAITVQK